jgi:tetratricopeptide (TPR) repeat protein
MVRKTLFGLSVLGFLVICPALAQRTSQNLSGGISMLQINVQLRLPGGEPGPAGIHVVLERAEGGMDSDCQTVEGGKCTLTPTENGVFTVRLRQTGYEEVTERVELVHSDHEYAMLTLRPLRRADGTTPAEDAPSGEISVMDYSIPEKARQEFAKGEAALRKKKPEDGAKHFQNAVKAYGNYPQAYRMLGEAYLQQKDWKRAEMALRRSIDLAPEQGPSYVDLGAVKNQEEDYPAAEEALKKGLELSPNSTPAKYELAKTYWAEGRWQDAEPYAEAAVKAVPDLAGAHALLGNILLRGHNPEGALKEYEEYLRLDPNGAMAAEVRDTIAKIEKALQGK